MRSLRQAMVWLSLWPILSCLATNSMAQLFDERFSDWPVELKINGTILAADSIDGLPAIAELLATRSLEGSLPAGDPPASDPPAGDRRDGSALPLIDLLSNRTPLEQWTEPFSSRGLEVTPESTGSAAPTVEAVNSAIGDTDGKPRSRIVVWLDDRSPTEISVDERQRLGERFRQHLNGNGILVVAGPHIELLSKWTLHLPSNVVGEDTVGEDTVGEKAVDNNATNNSAEGAGDAGPRWQAGLGLFPDCIILVDSQFAPAIAAVEDVVNGSLAGQQLLWGLQQHPRCVSLRVAPNSVLLLRGRKLQVVTGAAAIGLSSHNAGGVSMEQVVAPPHSPRQRPAEWLVDLTQWRRRAIDTTLEPFPPADVEVPHVPAGALVIVGGGGLPAGLMQRFVELAGGAEQARLVYVPCEEAEEVSERQGMVREWQQMGVNNVAVLHTKDRLRADRDESFFEPLREATGIWFGGGRQWNLADSYYGTTTHRLMKEVLQRGGVIGGSSAGASIQARYLARATPIENFDIMAPGYERGGLGFISGVAIDQHFSQRQRQRDMKQLVTRYPQLLGIGIDETTAIIVQQSLAEVVGEGSVYFYDANRPALPEQLDYEALRAGEAYDLANRRM